MEFKEFVNRVVRMEQKKVRDEGAWVADNGSGECHLAGHGSAKRERIFV
jgi:hypothetical protein